MSPSPFPATAATRISPATAAITSISGKTYEGFASCRRPGARLWSVGIALSQGRLGAAHLQRKSHVSKPRPVSHRGYFRSVSAVKTELKEQILHGDLRRQLGGYDSLDVLRGYYERADTTDPLSRIQYVDIKTYLTDDILVKVDRASMANSLEVRAPILDHKLMELAASMPSSIKAPGHERQIHL